MQQVSSSGHEIMHFIILDLEQMYLLEKRLADTFIKKNTNLVLSYHWMNPMVFLVTLDFTCCHIILSQDPLTAAYKLTPADCEPL